MHFGEADMFTMKINTVCFGFFLATLAWCFSGCASSEAPRQWERDPMQFARDSYGGWLHIEYKEALSAKSDRGEFIALQESTVYLLRSDGQIVLCPLKNIDHAHLEIHSENHGEFAAWTLIGTISTLTHGFGLMLTAPVWILSGSIAAASVSHIGKFDEGNPDPVWWKEMSQYARFPQGLPEKINLDKLHPRVP
jgi:hypothetical protein